MEIEVPRDRNGEFEPKVVPKNKRDISGIEDKVICLLQGGYPPRISMIKYKISTV